jgi:hypothetical protein
MGRIVGSCLTDSGGDASVVMILVELRPRLERERTENIRLKFGEFLLNKSTVEKRLIGEQCVLKIVKVITRDASFLLVAEMQVGTLQNLAQLGDSAQFRHLEREIVTNQNEKERKKERKTVHRSTEAKGDLENVLSVSAVPVVVEIAVRNCVIAASNLSPKREYTTNPSERTNVRFVEAERKFSRCAAGGESRRAVQHLRYEHQRAPQLGRLESLGVEG